VEAVWRLRTKNCDDESTKQRQMFTTLSPASAFRVSRSVWCCWSQDNPLVPIYALQYNRYLTEMGEDSVYMYITKAMALLYDGAGAPNRSPKVLFNKYFLKSIFLRIFVS
jgi:hypothetical protein